MKKSACGRVRDLDALAQRHEIVAAAHEHRVHAGLRVELLGDAARDRDARRPSRACRCGRSRRDRRRHGPRRSRRSRRGRPARPRSRSGRGVDAVGVAVGGACRTTGESSPPADEIDDEPIAVLLVRREQERLGLRGLGQLEHDAQARRRVAAPARTCATTPFGSGSDSGPPAFVSGRSITMRSGSASVKTRCSTGAVSSKTTRVESGPDHTRTLVDRRGGAARRGPEQQRAAQGLNRPPRPHPGASRTAWRRLMFTIRDRFFNRFL